MPAGEDAVSIGKISQVCYLLAATLSGGGVLLAGLGYFPGMGMLLLIVSGVCLVLGLVLVSEFSDEVMKDEDRGLSLPGSPPQLTNEGRETHGNRTA